MIMILLQWRIFQAQQQTFLFKITTYGGVQFMSWMQYCKSIYMDYTSGRLSHAQVSIVVTLISCRTSRYGSKTKKWPRLTSILCGFWWLIFHSSIHERRQNIPKLERSCKTQLIKRCNREYWPQGHLVYSISWIISERNSKSQSERRPREY